MTVSYDKMLTIAIESFISRFYLRSYNEIVTKRLIIKRLRHKIQVSYNVKVNGRHKTEAVTNVQSQIISCARTAGGDSGPSPARAPPPCLTASTYIYVWLRERGGPGVFHPTHA